MNNKKILINSSNEELATITSKAASVKLSLNAYNAYSDDSGINSLILKLNSNIATFSLEDKLHETKNDMLYLNNEYIETNSNIWSRSTLNTSNINVYGGDAIFNTKIEINNTNNNQNAILKIRNPSEYDNDIIDVKNTDNSLKMLLKSDGTFKISSLTFDESKIYSLTDTISFDNNNLETDGIIRVGNITIDGINNTINCQNDIIDYSNNNIKCGIINAASDSTIGNITISDNKIASSGDGISFDDEDLTTDGSLRVDTITINSNTITDSTGTISFGDENLTTDGSLRVDTITINSNTIIDSTGTLSFGTNNLTTDGSLRVDTITIDSNTIIDSTGTLSFSTNNLTTDGSLRVDTITIDSNTITDSTGTLSFSTNNLTTDGSLRVDTITIDSNTITDSTGTISFSDENLTTDGSLRVDTITIDSNTIIDSTGTLSFGANNLTTDGSLRVDTITIDSNTIIDSTGTLSFGANNLTTDGSLRVDTITINSNTITDSTGTIIFGDENLTTDGSLRVDTITIDSNTITDSTGTISFGTNNLTTDGSLRVDTITIDSNTIIDSTGTLSFSTNNLTTDGSLRVDTITIDNNTIIDSTGTLSFSTNNLTTDGSLRVDTITIDNNTIIDSTGILSFGTNNLTTDGSLRVDTITIDSNTITDSTGTISFGTNNLTTDGSLRADTITIDSNTITDSTGTISFGDENLTTDGSLRVDTITIDNNTITDSTGTISFVDQNLTTDGYLRVDTITIDNNTITDSTGTISFGDENLTTDGSLRVDTITIDSNTITDSTGTISFGNENLTTDGSLRVDTITIDSNTITDSTGTISFGDENLTTDGSLRVDTITIDSNTITDSTGIISFGNENLTTTGIITGSTIISSTEINNSSANNAVTTKLYVDTKIANNIGDGIDLDFITVKEYIDTKIQGLDIKDSVKIATNQNITLSGEQTIQQINIEENDRVLVKSQTLKKDNGIYICKQGSWERSSDFNDNNEIKGSFTFVEEGENANSGYVCKTSGNIILGTTEIEFSQFSGAGQIIAGLALSKTGNKIDIVGSEITETGALNSGSITSGFGDINIGSSTITTSGIISGTNLKINEIISNDINNNIDFKNSILVSDGSLRVDTITIDSNTIIDSTGTLSFSTNNLTTDGSLRVDTITIDSNTITDSTGIISFGNENLTTDGSLRVDTITIDSNTITDSTGTISFGNENLTTDGSLRVDTITIDSNTITDSTGTISFSDENLTTDGSLRVDTITIDSNTIIDSTGTLSFGTNNLTTDGSLRVDTITIDNNTIIDSTGTLSFGTNNLTTDGSLRVDTITIDSNTIIDSTGTLSFITNNLTTDGSLRVDTITIDSNTITDSTGTISFGTNNLTTDGSLRVDTITIDSNIIIDSTGTLSFGANNLTTDGSLRVDTITIDNNTITDSTGTISFSDENLITDGSLRVDTITIDSNTITDSTGTISFGDENLTTDGSLCVDTITIDSNTIIDSTGTLSFGTNNLTTDGSLRIDTITIDSNTITDSTGTLSFGTNNLTTDGSLRVDTITIDSNTITDSTGTLSFGTNNLTTDGSLRVDTITIDSNTITDSTGTLSFGTNNLTTDGSLRVDTITINSNTITDFTGTISFGDENLTTDGSLRVDTITIDSNTITDSTGTISFGTNNLTTDGSLRVDTITIDSNTITDSTGTISFGTNNLTTDGSLRVDTITIDSNTITDSTGTLSFGTNNLTTDGSLRIDTITIDSNTIIDSTGTLNFSTNNLTTDGSLRVDTITIDNNTITDSTGTLSFGTNNLTSDGSLRIDTITIDSNTIIDSTGTISFGTNNLTTDGSLRVDTITIDNNTIIDSTGTLSFSTNNLTTDGTLRVDTITIDSNTITDSTGTLSFGTNNLTTDGSLRVDSITIDSNTITDSTGTISFGDENLTTDGSLRVDTITIDSNTITDSTGTISFGDENLETDGSLRIDTITINSNIITDSSGTLSFGTNIITTDGSLKVDTITIDGNTITDLTGTLSFGTNNLTTDGSLRVDSITIDSNTIIDSTGTLSFSTNNLTTDGSLRVDTITIDNNTITDSTGTLNFSTNNLTTDGSLRVDTITIDSNTITDSTGTISFSDENLVTTGTISTNNIILNLTTLTVTGTELNILDGNTSAENINLEDSDQLIVNDNTLMKQITMSTLANYMDDKITNMPNLVQTGVLNSGSIASGFGDIDTGSSQIKTTGTIEGGMFKAFDNLSSSSDNKTLTTKLYVDTEIRNAIQGLDIKDSVKVATHQNITLSGIPQPEDIQDVILSDGDRVLVKSQTAKIENGIYICKEGAWERSSDFNDDNEIKGSFTFVEEGNNANSGYVCITSGSIGIHDIEFSQFSGAGQITDGNGLVKNGNEISIDLKANGGLIIESQKLALNLSASDITGTLAVVDGGTGADNAANARINLGISGIETNLDNQLVISTDIIPDTDSAYDIGSSEKKIRDLYVSDNSIWIGDQHKISHSDGKLKFRKRKTEYVPVAIQNLYPGAQDSQILESLNTSLNTSISSLSDVKLNNWIKFYKNIKTTDGNRGPSIQELFRDNTEDYDEEISTDAWLTKDTNIYMTNYTKIGIGTQNPLVSLDINKTDAIKIPKGSTSDRPINDGDVDDSYYGSIRYNTELKQFEGFGEGYVWGSLGGVKDIDNDTYITAEESNDEDKLKFYTNKTSPNDIPRMIIDNSGNVGINTTSPIEKLDINGNVKAISFIGNGAQITDLDATNLTGTIDNERLPSDIAIGNDLQIGGNLTLTGKIVSSDSNVEISNQLIVENSNTGPALIVNQTGIEAIVDIRDNNSSVLYVKDGGNVGIKNDNPSYDLHVNNKIGIGSSTVNGSDGTLIINKRVTSDNLRSIEFKYDDNYNFCLSDNGNKDQFKMNYNAPENSLVINDSGNIGINTEASITHKLLINGNVSASGYIGDGSAITSLNASEIKTGTMDNSILPESINITNDIIVGNDLQIGGDLTLTGKIQSSDSNVEISKQLIVNNISTGPALQVNQTGSGTVIDIRDNNSSVLYVKDGGNVGMGTNNPYYKLDFGRFATGGTTSDYGGMLAIYNNEGNYLYGIDADYYGSGWGINFYASATGKSENNIRMKIDSNSGNIGIGTTSPTEKLHVNGNVKANYFIGNGVNITDINASKITSGTLDNSRLPNNIVIGNDLQIGGDLTLTGKIESSDSDIKISKQLIVENNNTGPALIVNQTGSGAVIDIKDNNSSVVYVKDGGAIGIGTTQPASKLHIHYSTNNTGIRISTDNQAYNLYTSDIYNSDGAGFSIQNISDFGKVPFRIKSDGSILLNAYDVDNNVGIGVQNPNEKLEVIGNVKATSFIGNGTNITDLDATKITTGTINNAILPNNITINNDLVVNNDLTIKGTLNLVGEVTTTETQVQISEQLIVTNDGTGPAVQINQTGYQPVIDIQDDGVSVFYIEDGGYVGIGTTNPSEKLELYNGRIKIYRNDDNPVLHLQSDLLSNVYNTYLFINRNNGTFYIRNNNNIDVEIDVNGNIIAPSYTGDGSAITSLNANQIISGTINNLRLPQSIGISDYTTYNGKGTNITELDATKITIGTVSPNRLPIASDSIFGVVKVDNSTIIINNDGVIAAQYGDSDVSDLLESGINTNIETSGNIIGNGSQITDLNADNINLGTVSPNRLPIASDSIFGVVKVDNSTILVNSDGVISGAAQYGDSDVETLLESGISTNIQTSANIIGNGSQITNLNADNIVSGTINNSRLPNDITISNNLVVNNDLTINGNLNLVGEVTTTETQIQISEQLVVTNTGTGPAVKINQTGDQPIIDIQDDGISSFYIEDGGNVGIGTTNPSEKLEVNGKIRVSDSVILNSSTSSQYVSLPSDSTNLKAHYKFDEGEELVDSAGNYPLTNSGTDVIFSSSEKLIGKSSYFPASGTNYLSITNQFNPYTIWNGNGITFSWWMKLNSSEQYGRTFEFGSSSSSTSSYRISNYAYNGTNTITIKTNVQIVNEPLFPDNNGIGVWKHYVWCVDANGVWSSYLNGVNQNISVTANIPDMTYTISRLGESIYGGPSDKLQGYLDDFRVYNKVLTQNEVTTLYNIAYDIIEFKGSYNDLNNKLVFSNDYFNSNNNVISLNTEAIAGLSINNQGDNIIIDELGKINVAFNNAIGSYSPTLIYTDLYPLTIFNITIDTVDQYKLIYDESITNANKLNKGDIIKFNNGDYKRVYNSTDTFFTLYNDINNAINEDHNTITNYTSYNKVNFKLLFDFTGDFNESSSNIETTSENYTKVVIPKNRIYTFNINVNFDLEYGTSYSVLYVKLKRTDYEGYIRTFYSPSISPAYHNFSSSINASFKLKLQEGDEITFETNYKLHEGFIDIDL